MKSELDDKGLELRRNLNNLKFEDDIVLQNNSGENYEKLTNEFHRESLKVGLTINNKTKLTL